MSKSFSERHYHHCRHDGCDSQADWQLLLQLNCRHPADWNRPAFMLKMPSTLCVCDKHTKAALSLVTNEDTKTKLRMVCLQQGYGFPDFDSMVAMFAPVDHATVKEQLQ